MSTKKTTSYESWLALTKAMSMIFWVKEYTVLLAEKLGSCICTLHNIKPTLSQTAAKKKLLLFSGQLRVGGGVKGLSTKGKTTFFMFFL